MTVPSPRRHHADVGQVMTGAIKRVMVVTAHPDDPEFGAGGTIANRVVLPG